MNKVLSMLLALMLLMISAYAIADAQTVNIAVTNTIEYLNPLLVSASEAANYALGLQFLPLMELDRDMNFVPMLAESITTEDSRTFTITLAEGACWSDGVPVTAEDVSFTLELMASPECTNIGMMLYAIEGVGDDNLAESADGISGIRIVDDRMLTISCDFEMALMTFQNNFGRYLMPLPKHVLADIPRSELLTNPWFNHPDVISGPYYVDSFDLAHTVRFRANAAYFRGEPKIPYLNINVTDASQLYAGLLSGEIDLIQQTTASLPEEDAEAVAALANVTAVEGAPVTNESIFINCANVPDARIRRAILLGLDRETAFNEIIGGRGELVDGFVVSRSPYFSEELGLTAYDPETAAQLVAEAKADGAATALTWYCNAGELAFNTAVEYFAATLEDIGLQITIRTVDLSTLMSVANEGTFDLMSVEYTYTPVDPYTDEVWLLGADGWTRYGNEEVINRLTASQSMTDVNDIIDAYLYADRMMQQDAPMISGYVKGSLGAVSHRLKNAVPDVFGTFVNVHEWEITE